MAKEGNGKRKRRPRKRENGSRKDLIKHTGNSEEQTGKGLRSKVRKLKELRKENESLCGFEDVVEPES